MHEESDPIVVGLIAAPGAPARVAAQVRDELAGDLARSYPEVRWRVALVQDGLVEPGAAGLEVVERGRERLLAEDWDFAICLTDLPLRIARRPVKAHASSMHAVGIIALPALGVRGVPRKVRDTSARLVEGLSRALAAAGAAVVFALVTPDLWSLADSLGWGRLTGLSIASVVGVCATLIVAHGLWERARAGRVREQIVLFNMVTLVTVLIGVLALHAALFFLTAAGAAVLLTPGVLEEALGHAVGPLDYAQLSWLIASLATVGGALGAGIEQTDRVREAAYAFRPDEQVEEAET
ncbi:MAG: hypothetical protein MSC31_06620 [Solirubrobacteraceae bacterium MAG38_C4-C5]|nr:hypothetical protein [Candidatus Siliceabacter maunaloa]